MPVIISYLVPSYNHARYLLEFLQYIALDMQQLDVAAELIIIDDGSTDGLPDIISSWLNAHTDKLQITYLSQQNRGLAATLNSMLDLAKGTYIRLCASDDVIIPGSTQVLYNQFQKTSANCICMLGNARIIDANGITIDINSINFHGGNIHRLETLKSLVKELIQIGASPAHPI